MARKTEKFSEEDIENNETDAELSIEKINEEPEDEDLLLSVEEPKTAENASSVSADDAGRYGKPPHYGKIPHRKHAC